MIDCIEKQHVQTHQQQPLQSHHLTNFTLTNSQPSQILANGQQQAPLTIYPSNQPIQQPLIEIPSQQQSNNNELIGYYFGSISRETAEWILKTHGNRMDGAYLLRSSGSNDDFVLSLLVLHQNSTIIPLNQQTTITGNDLEVLHYKIVETEDSFVALHGQVGDEKFATIDELIEKAQGVATKPRWPIGRQSLESQILPPTYWGLTVDQIRLAILLKAKQWGFPLLSPIFQQQQQDSLSNNVPSQQQQGNITETVNNTLTPNTTTLNNETIRTLIYKSLHEFQPWFHGGISREEAERRIEDGPPRDGRFLVRERDNYSYAMCISHKKTTKHYRIDVLPTGELAIQDGRKFTSLMALVSHYTIMSDGLWCALTEACPRPIQPPNGMTSNTLNRDGFTYLGDASNVPTLMNGSNNIFSNHLTQVRIPPSNQYNTVMNQSNLYCVPPIASDTNAGAHQIMLPPLNHINNGSSSEQQLAPKQMESLSSIQSQSPSAIDVRKVNGSTKNQPHANSLICSHHNSGVTSIKTPIKEWLQTINHKWSQLLAAKSQHQSLNSFLFGNQNPLNNNCRHNNHRNQHHMNHRRKCKNGHTSCACIQQMIFANRAAIMTSNNRAIGTNDNGQVQLNQTTTTTNRFKDSEISGAKVQNCCSATHCPGSVIGDRQNQQITTALAQRQQQHLAQQSNLPFGERSAASCAALNAANNSLLSCMPQNSGFTLSSQSFIGSSLFAVKPMAQVSSKNHREIGGHHSGSSNSGGSSSTSMEEKLISPAQSSANINNTYSADIYGSQTSTAIVNDRLPATSSSSSSGTNALAQQRASLNANGALGYNLPRCGPGGGVPLDKSTVGRNEHVQQIPVKAQVPQVVQAAGPIMCGQHAGPAYRYTNCNDENSFKTCFHRTPTACYRAADDSQLLTTSTQLAGPAAMAKFVQFQDGQCLRTHRDTRSIQMAYLSSRQTASLNNERNLSRNNQMPLKELGNSQQRQNTLYLAKNNAHQINFDSMNVESSNNSYQANDLSLGQVQPKHRMRANHSWFDQEGNSQRSIKLMQQHNRNNACSVGKDIDLMDCGENEDSFDFKYDPKLIKSSSIETLCGEEREDTEITMDSLSNCKSNAELMMSLQNCWLANQGQQQQPPDILNPIQICQSNATTGNDSASEPTLAAKAAVDDETDATNQASLLSSLITVDGSQNQQLDHMRKKHDLDELTTALLAELTASLKAQVDLKNKRSGFGLHISEKAADNQVQQDSSSSKGHQDDHDSTGQTNPLELINEFDTLISNNR